MIDYDLREYDRYLDSEEWQDLRDRAFREQGAYCQICTRTEPLQVHHCDYSNNPELAVLCDGCHEMISQMVIEFNSTPWSEKLKNTWCSEFLTRWITDLYKKQYCRSEKKPVNFLDRLHLQRVIKICRHTLFAQCNEKDYVLRKALLNRLSSCTCQIEIQRSVCEYRIKYQIEASSSGDANYRIRRYLGIKKLQGEPR